MRNNFCWAHTAPSFVANAPAAMLFKSVLRRRFTAPPFLSFSLAPVYPRRAVLCPLFVLASYTCFYVNTRYFCVFSSLLWLLALLFGIKLLQHLGAHQIPETAIFLPGKVCRHFAFVHERDAAARAL